MKTLEQFWHWYDNEHPDLGDAIHKARQRLSPRAWHALSLSYAELMGHLMGTARTGSSRDSRALVSGHADELRHLSLAIMAALSEMAESVPPGPHTVSPGQAIRWRKA
jgi:hypothetical protein